MERKRAIESVQENDVKTADVIYKPVLTGYSMSGFFSAVLNVITVTDLAVALRAGNGSKQKRIVWVSLTTLTGSEEAIIGANQRTVVNSDHYLKATDIVLEAGQSFTVKGPGGFMTIDESGITLQGNLVKVNEGGSPGVGTAPVSVEPESPAAPALPDAPLRP